MTCPNSGGTLFEAASGGRQPSTGRRATIAKRSIINCSPLRGSTGFLTGGEDRCARYETVGVNRVRPLKSEHLRPSFPLDGAFINPI